MFSRPSTLAPVRRQARVALLVVVAVAPIGPATAAWVGAFDSPSVVRNTQTRVYVTFTPAADAAAARLTFSVPGCDFRLDVLSPDTYRLMRRDATRDTGQYCASWLFATAKLDATRNPNVKKVLFTPQKGTPFEITLHNR